MTRVRVVAVVAVGLLLVTIGVGVVLDRRIDRIPVRLSGSDRGTTWLLVGSDSRAFVSSDEEAKSFGTTAIVPGERADVIVAVRVVDGRTTVLSIPRDVLVRDPSGRRRRLATVWTPRPQAFVDVLCRYFGIAVDHVAVMRFDGFARVVDAAGGVDVEVDRPVRDAVTGLDLRRAGRHHLDGRGALAWIRSRSAEELVDGTWTPVAAPPEQRGARAAEVVAQLAGRARSPLHPIRAARVAFAATSALETDRGTGLVDLARLAPRVDGARRPVSVPVVPIPGGEIPVARLRPEAARLLRPFSGSGCRTTAFGD